MSVQAGRPGVRPVAGTQSYPCPMLPLPAYSAWPKRQPRRYANGYRHPLGGVPGQEMLFFLLLFTLIVTLHDRWRPIYDLRLQSERR